MSNRFGGFVFLAVAGLAFLLIAIALLRSFGRPPEQWINAGPVTEFPPSESPYLLRNTPPVYIVNIRGDLIALSGKDPHRYGQIVDWYPEENRFIDPVTGSNYWLDGSFDIRFLPDGPEQLDMERFPIKIQDGILWIQLPETN